MCQFIKVMERLKSSSSSSVANEEFSRFNEYMHIPCKMDDRLENVINKAKKKSKSLVLVCGNSGDGKSHLIANFIDRGIIDNKSAFGVYIDATSSDRKGMRANEKLREKLDLFSDAKINDEAEKRLIVAINLGVLNDFLKNYEREFTTLKKYVDEQGLFDNIPAWKFALMSGSGDEDAKCYIGHVDFTSFHRYEITQTGIDSTFIESLLNKIVDADENNFMYKEFQDSCHNCLLKTNCPVCCNYSALVQNKGLRRYIVSILTKSIIRNNLSPSVREINDFFYEIIIGSTFNENKINDSSIERLNHFMHNLTMWILFEESNGLLGYTCKEDIFNDKARRCDQQLISLNLKPSLKKWLQEDVVIKEQVFSQILSDIVYCETNYAKMYRKCEQKIRQDIFKLYIRMDKITNPIYDEAYEDFLKYLYAYNCGDEKKCADIINLIKECAYLWNGRLGDKTGANVKNGIIIGKGTSRYYLYKEIEFVFSKNKEIKPLTELSEYSNFSSVMRFGFSLKEKPNKVIKIDVDYELYEFLLAVRSGYVPTNNDRKKNVKYDSFVRNLITESEKDLCIYSRVDDGKLYRISKDEFDSYVFECEV